MFRRMVSVCFFLSLAGSLPSETLASETLAIDVPAKPASTEYVVPPTRCYSTTDFAIDTLDGQNRVHLAGAFTAPKGGGERPTILMITGTGPHMRDQTISGVPMFAMIANFLARDGYNVVRTDSRGSGKSTIDGKLLEGAGWLTVTSPDRYRDNNRLLDYLLTRPDVQKNGLIVLGHSEGAMIGARLSADRKDLALAVLLSDSTAPGGEVFAYQRTPIVGRNGVTQEIADTLHGNFLDLAAFMNGNQGDDARFEVIAKEFEDAQKTLPKPPYPRDFLEFHRTKSPFHGYLMTYDPYQDLARIRTPVLAVYGGADESTPWRIHAPILARALAAAGNSDFAVHVIPDEDHFFLEYQGKRVDRHPFGQVRIANELRDLLVGDLDRRFGRHGALCQG
jgi:pimeloyl-ACP methyl ester carboxylesterase